MAFILTSVQLLLGSRRCRRAQASDSSARTHCCAACLAHGAVDALEHPIFLLALTAVQLVWLTALSTCSYSRWPPHSLPCSSLIPLAVDALMYLVAVILIFHAACLARCAVDALMRSMTLRLISVQLAFGSRCCRCAHAADGLHTHCRAACVAHSATDSLIQSVAHSYSLPYRSLSSRVGAIDLRKLPMALVLTTVQPARLTVLSTCSCSRWPPYSLPSSSRLALESAPSTCS